MFRNTEGQGIGNDVRTLYNVALSVFGFHNHHNDIHPEPQLPPPPPPTPLVDSLRRLDALAEKGLIPSFCLLLSKIITRQEPFEIYRHIGKLLDNIKKDNTATIIDLSALFRIIDQTYGDQKAPLKEDILNKMGFIISSLDMNAISTLKELEILDEIQQQLTNREKQIIDHEDIKRIEATYDRVTSEDRREMGAESQEEGNI